jgi:hypothetical protein
MVFLTTGFAPVFPEKRLELKSLNGWTKADEEGAPWPFLLSFRLSLKALQFEPFLRKKLVQYGGTEGAARGYGPPLKT